LIINYQFVTIVNVKNNTLWQTYNDVNKVVATLLGFTFGLLAVFLLQTIDVLAQIPATNNQSGNTTLSNGTANQSNTVSNNTTTNAFDSLKDTFGSLFGK
jgi:hypothetical protein